jgi:ribosomal protein RSM22 (predicted rRNA methylase)
MRTIKELKELLNNYPDDMLVVVRGYEGGFDDISDTAVITLKRDANSDWYYGAHKKIDKSEAEYGIDHLYLS